MNEEIDMSRLATARRITRTTRTHAAIRNEDGQIVARVPRTPSRRIAESAAVLDSLYGYTG